jgi:hypothetical protein
MPTIDLTDTELAAVAAATSRREASDDLHIDYRRRLRSDQGRCRSAQSRPSR